MTTKTTNNKQSIVFVHGAWHGKWCWDKYFKQKFIDQGYNVVTFDLPGHEASGRIKDINKYSIQDYVKALKNEVQKLDHPPVIVGHSMGGMILQKYLETASCKKAIFLASVPPYGVIKATLKFAKKTYFLPSVLGLNLYGFVDTIKKSKQAFFSDNIPQKDLVEFSSQLCSESFKAFLNLLIPIVRVNENAKIPTLVVGAKNDTIFSERDNLKTAKKFNATFMMVDDIAHDMMLDPNHEKVSNLMIQWLKKTNK